MDTSPLAQKRPLPRPFAESPALHPDEHAWIEQLVGRALTNEEAQALLREAKLTASWEDIYGKKGLSTDAHR
jgi:hypothetical protein